MIGSKPYGELRYRDVKGRRMAYIDEGEGDAIVFQHGQPASSYIWRNVMPHVEGLGRIVACDLIGMGASDKLSPGGPGSYTYAEHRDYLFALWDALRLGDRVVLVGHDWGAVLALDWARNHATRVQGIAFMEFPAGPMRWSDLPGQSQDFFKLLRTPEGEQKVLEENFFLETRLPGSIMRKLTPEEWDYYRRPFAKPGEDRRPTLMWPRSLPLDGDPADVTRTIVDNGAWAARSDIPKLLIRAEPGALVRGPILESIRSWPNRTEVTVKGVHAIQEDSPDEIGTSIAYFVRRLRGSH